MPKHVLRCMSLWIGLVGVIERFHMYKFTSITLSIVTIISSTNSVYASSEYCLKNIYLHSAMMTASARCDKTWVNKLGVITLASKNKLCEDNPESMLQKQKGQRDFIRMIKEDGIMSACGYMLRVINSAPSWD